MSLGSLPTSNSLQERSIGRSGEETNNYRLFGCIITRIGRKKGSYRKADERDRGTASENKSLPTDDNRATARTCSHFLRGASWVEFFPKGKMGLCLGLTT